MSVVRGLPRVFREAKAILAESPVWDDSGHLYWCDISAGLLHRSAFDGFADSVVELPPPLASFAPAASGGFVASLGDRIVRLDVAGAIVADLAHVEHIHAGLRLNEGKCDPYGRWLTGSMNLTTGEPDGALYSITPVSRQPVSQASITGPLAEIRTVRGGFGVANGFEWSLDDTEMYFTDTSVKTIYRAPYSPEGVVGEVKVFHSGLPHDGLTIDADGYLWGGIYGGGMIVRYDPDGREDLRVELPAPNITGVTFGGPGLSTLFVGSARENLTEADLEAHPLSGSIFAIETSTHGRPARTYGG